MQDNLTVALHHKEDPKTDFLGVFHGHGMCGEIVASYGKGHLGTEVLQDLLALDLTGIETAVKEVFI